MKPPPLKLRAYQKQAIDDAMRDFGSVTSNTIASQPPAMSLESLMDAARRLNERLNPHNDFHHVVMGSQYHKAVVMSAEFIPMVSDSGFAPALAGVPFYIDNEMRPDVCEFYNWFNQVIYADILKGKSSNAS